MSNEACFVLTERDLDIGKRNANHEQTWTGTSVAFMAAVTQLQMPR